MSQSPRSPIRILLVEDNPADADIVLRCLRPRAEQYTVEHCNRVELAAAALASRAFDLVLSDLTLPDSSGLETVETMLACAGATPVVVLTGAADDELAMAALDMGAQDFLEKGSFGEDVLKRAIRYSMQRQHCRVEIERLLSQVEQTQQMLVRKNRRLKKLYKTARRFVNHVSHEFRTPLTVIKEYVSLMSDGLVGNVTERQQRFLSIISDRADDLNHMVDDMLDVSRLDAGLMGMLRRTTTVAGIMAHVADGLQRKADLKQVSVVIDVPDDLPAVFCDPEKAGRVLLNFGVNAIKFAGEPGEVRVVVRSRSESNDVEFSVIDNGPGIAPEDVESLGKRFHQLGTAARGSTKGFGLGLSIARELAALNLGEMRVESELNRGSKFSFAVPVADPVEVVRRYLEHLEHSKQAPEEVTFLSVGLDAKSCAEGAEDVDAFLSFLLRRDDLVFRLGPCQWLVALACPQSELTAFFERAEKTQNDLNRNRPSGPLPHVGFEQHAVWRLERNAESLAKLIASIGRGGPDTASHAVCLPRPSPCAVGGCVMTESSTPYAMT